MKVKLVLTSGTLMLVAACATNDPKYVRVTPLYQSTYTAQTTTTTQESTGAAPVAQTGTGQIEVLNQDELEIQLRKEELVVGKREVSNGGIRIRTVVHTEEVSKPVELQREEFVVERIPAGSEVDKQYRAEGASFQGREVYLPLMKEEPVSGKRTLLTETIKIGKKIETEQQTVSMPIRSEDVQIVKDPNLSDPKFASVPRKSAAGAPPTAQTAPPATSAGDENTIMLGREEFVVSKQAVDGAGLYVQKVVQTTTASEPIELRREEATVERTPASGEATGVDFSERQIAINLKKEEAVAGVRNYLTETVRLRKQKQTDQQMVAGTVRTISAEVEKLAQGGTASDPQVSVISESAPANDAQLTQLVQTSLEKGIGSPAIDSSKIKIEAKDGVVILKGTVPTAWEKETLESEVKKMSGVRSVKNEINVQAP
jgi:uncharacterized protein (TIGR02271 family)